MLLLSLAGGCHQGEEPSFRVSRARAEDRAGAVASPQRPEEPTPTAPREAQVVPVQAPAEAAPAVAQGEVDPRLLAPGRATERAPEMFVAELETTEGTVHIEVHRAWSPNGADRFYNMVRLGYFQDVAFFRVIAGFMGQAGIHGDPRVAAAWRDANIPDDPVVQHNTRGMVTFAMSGVPNSRSNQFFINFGDNSRLDGMGFAPFGRVREADMAIVDRLHAGYGEGAPNGRGPEQGRVQREGNAYLRAQFPALDYIRSARVAPAAQREAQRP